MNAGSVITRDDERRIGNDTGAAIQICLGGERRMAPETLDHGIVPTRRRPSEHA